jgi:hypothetical protein
MVVLVLLQLQRKIVKQRQTRRTRRQERGDQKKRVPEEQFFLG